MATFSKAPNQGRRQTGFQLIEKIESAATKVRKAVPGSAERRRREAGAFAAAGEAEASAAVALTGTRAGSIDAIAARSRRPPVVPRKQGCTLA